MFQGPLYIYRDLCPQCRYISEVFGQSIDNDRCVGEIARGGEREKERERLLEEERESSLFAT